MYQYACCNSGLANMQRLKKLFAGLGHLNSFSNTFNKHNNNKCTKHNMTTLLQEKIFTNYNLLLVRQHTVYENFFVFYQV
jgi:hypothetical protein